MASAASSTSAGAGSPASWPLVDPLKITPADVEYQWQDAPPPTLPVLAARVEAICRTEAARLGYDKVIIRSLPHDTTTVKGQKGHVKDVMHITVTFQSKYFIPLDPGYKRAAHIPVHMYDPATKTATEYEMNSTKRGAKYPYQNLAMKAYPTYSHTEMDRNPFPIEMRKAKMDRPSRPGTPASGGKSGASSAASSRSNSGSSLLAGAAGNKAAGKKVDNGKN